MKPIDDLGRWTMSAKISSFESLVKRGVLGRNHKRSHAWRSWGSCMKELVVNAIVVVKLHAQKHPQLYPKPWRYAQSYCYKQMTDIVRKYQEAWQIRCFHLLEWLHNDGSFAGQTIPHLWRVASTRAGSIIEKTVRRYNDEPVKSPQSWSQCAVKLYHIVLNMPAAKPDKSPDAWKLCYWHILRNSLHSDSAWDQAHRNCKSAIGTVKAKLT